VGLAKRVEELYYGFREEHCLQLTHDEFESIYNQIQDGTYKLSPFLVYDVAGKRFYDHFSRVSYFCHRDLRFFPSSTPGYITVVRPNNQDALVLRALAVFLLMLTTDRECNDLDNLFSLFQLNIEKLGDVDRLYRLNVNINFEERLLLLTVKKYVGDGFVFNLVESYLQLPSMVEGGSDLK